MRRRSSPGARTYAHQATNGTGSMKMLKSGLNTARGAPATVASAYAAYAADTRSARARNVCACLRGGPAVPNRWVSIALVIVVMPSSAVRLPTYDDRDSTAIARKRDSVLTGHGRRCAELATNDVGQEPDEPGRLAPSASE